MTRSPLALPCPPPHVSLLRQSPTWLKLGASRRVAAPCAHANGAADRARRARVHAQPVLGVLPRTQRQEVGGCTTHDLFAQHRSAEASFSDTPARRGHALDCWAGASRDRAAVRTRWMPRGVRSGSDAAEAARPGFASSWSSRNSRPTRRRADTCLRLRVADGCLSRLAKFTRSLA